MRLLKRGLLIAAAALLMFLTLFAAGVLWREEDLDAVITKTPFAIANVDVVDVVAGTIARGRTVVVERGRIRSVDTNAAPPGLRVVDGRGKFLLPALWDMHGHVTRVSPLVDLPLYVAYGVTNVRDMQGCPQSDDPFIACAEDKRRWTADALSGRRVGPRVVASTSWMAEGPGIAARLGDVPPFFDTATPDQAREFVRYFAPRVDAIKVYNRIPRDAYFALVDEARRLNVDVVGHRPYAVSAIEAAANQRSIEHARFILQESFAGSAKLRRRDFRETDADRRRMLEKHDPQLANAIFEALKTNGTWYVPTHITRWSDAYADHESVREDPLLVYVHPLVQRQWLEDVDELLAEDPSPQARETYRRYYLKGLQLTGEAQRAGVMILAGTDYIAAGADLHRELQHLRAAGLTPAEVLRAATISPAQYFGLESEYGSVDAGKVADLILLDGNPLDDVRNSQRIAAVIFNGNLYDRDALDNIRTHVKRRARSWTVGCKIVWRFVKNPAGY